MTIDELNERRKELGYSYKKLAQLSGVPLGTIQKIFSGQTKTPRYRTLNALRAILMPEEKDAVREPHDDAASCIAEEAISYQIVPGNMTKHYDNNSKTKGKLYTIEDYLAWPEEERIELIDGVIYDMAAPTTGHQEVVFEIGTQLRMQLKGKDAKCRAFISPCDVQVDCSKYTMVQPDVFMVCDRDKINDKRIVGSPDFIVEVLSKSTAKKDMLIKAVKYESSGVREYWMVDIERQQVIVYIFDAEQGPLLSVHSFDEKVPVSVTGGEIAIDFSEVRHELIAIGVIPPGK